MTITHHAEYLLPGLLMPESTRRTLTERSVTEALEHAPEAAFCFKLYSTETPPDLGPDFTVTPKRKDESGRYYIAAEVFTAEQIEALPGDYTILLANMRGNRWDRLVRCRTGNWQPLEDGDVVLEAAATLPEERTNP